jgi:hypothetical protein
MFSEKEFYVSRFKNQNFLGTRVKGGQGTPVGASGDVDSREACIAWRAPAVVQWGAWSTFSPPPGRTPGTSAATVQYARIPEVQGGLKIVAPFEPDRRVAARLLVPHPGALELFAAPRPGAVVSACTE